MRLSGSGSGKSIKLPERGTTKHWPKMTRIRASPALHWHVLVLQLELELEWNASWPPFKFSRLHQMLLPPFSIVD